MAIVFKSPTAMEGETWATTNYTQHTSENQINCNLGRKPLKTVNAL